MTRKAKKGGPRKNASAGKPYPEFPLTPHASGRWRKVYRGTAYWFGPLYDWEAALDRYKHDWPYIIAGKRPPAQGVAGEYQTLVDAINIFLAAKDDHRKNGELSDVMLADYLATAKLILKAVDGNRDVDSIDQEDFRDIRAKLAKGRGLVTLANHVTRARSIFKFMVEEGLRSAPLHYGQGFSKPTARSIKRHRESQPDKTFTPEELRVLLDAASPAMRAMIYLGLNAAYGNQDLADLNHRDLNFKTGVLKVARGKTGNPRRVPLWPQTIAAIELATERRREPANPENRDAVFLTVNGLRLRRSEVVEVEGGRVKPRVTDGVQVQFRRLLDKTGLHTPGRGFYGLRHTFRTVTDGLADRPAVELVMGHDASGMRAHYVRHESITPDRLQAVADHVRLWLMGGDAE